VFPAHAGMNRPLVDALAFLVPVPRVCGDEPGRDSARGSVEQCSPRMRG